MQVHSGRRFSSDAVIASAIARDSLTVARQRGILTRFPVRSLGRLRTREHKIVKSNSPPLGSDMNCFDYESL
jgi:hypothetical protein